MYPQNTEAVPAVLPYLVCPLFRVPPYLPQGSVARKNEEDVMWEETALSGRLESVCLFLPCSHGDLPGPGGCREMSIVAAWQRLWSELLARDRTSPLLFPKQKAAVSN